MDTPSKDFAADSRTVPFLKKFSTKIALGFLFVIMTLSIVFFAINRNFSQKNLRNIMQQEISATQKTFRNLEQNDTKTLSAAIEVITQDPAIRALYLKKDRDQLYEYTSPLFRNLKEKYGITHWYFISPDGHTFLRVHDKEIYGDEVSRFTFIKARDTGNTASGIELGKTAYAFRVVTPYYYQGALIGYVELGEEIGHFLKVLRQETTSDFFLIADKKYLNREDWHFVMQNAGKEDTWDKIGGEHLLLEGTTEDASRVACITEENLEGAEEGENLFQLVRIGEKTYQCAGFSFDDARGRHSGAVLAQMDADEQVFAATQVDRSIFVTSVFLFLLSAVIGFWFLRRLINPINILSRTASTIASGNLETRAHITTDDEVGLLARNFNKMADSLVEVRTYPESIIRSMVDSLIFVDNEGVIKEVNQAFVDLLGYTKEEITGQSLQKITWTNDDSLIAFLNKVKTEESLGNKMICGVDTSFRAKDGIDIPVEISCSLMKDDKGIVKGMVLVAKNVRVEREAEEKLRLSEQQLRAANQQLESSQGQLQAKLSEMEQFNRVVVGRELKMAELKKEIESLKQRLGEQ